MGDGIRRIALAYFDGANEEEKKEAKEYFTKLDLNGDGKISFAEFKKVFDDYKIFNKLDSNHDGALYFPDVLVLFYHKKGAISIHQCDGCGEKLLDPYFTCFKCLPNSPHTYDLCCSCYRGGQFKHDHPLTDLLHSEAAHLKFIHHAQIKSETEGLRRMVSAFHERAGEEKKNNAEAFFRKLDSNGDGKISLTEYKEHVREYKEDVEPWLSGDEVFKKLDSNGDGVLDFCDTLLLFYEVTFFSCCGCCKPIFGPFFCCFLCLGKYPNTYGLCCECYREGKFQHEHPLEKLYSDQRAFASLIIQQNTRAKSETEGIRRIASVYYERADEVMRNKAEAFFRKLDSNGDGKISLTEYKDNAQPWLSGEEVFNKLDSDGDGSLDFSDALVLFYDMIFLHCSGCSKPIFGPFFTCYVCLDKHHNSYHLCCECCRGGKYQHEHQQIFDDQYALVNFIKKTQAQEKSEMEQLGEIARAHYQAAPPEVQELPKKLFNAMDADGDGKVDLPEFLNFMRQEGYEQMSNPQIFKELDKDGHGTLDFWETVTLYYIFTSRRPHCDMCRQFIPGIFYSCIFCFVGSTASSFNLCLRCHQNDDCEHNHNGHVRFLDNCTLLQFTREWAVRGANSLDQHGGKVAFNMAIGTVEVADMASKCTIM